MLWTVCKIPIPLPPKHLHFLMSRSFSKSSYKKKFPTITDVVEYQLMMVISPES